MQESPHEREGIDNASWVSFRGLTGLVGLVALVWIAAVLGDDVYNILTQRDRFGRFMDPLSLTVFVFSPAGWVGLVYACWIRSGRITGSALAFVLALGVCGMAISLLTLVGRQHAPPPNEITMATVFFTGTWILNGLGIVWVVDWVRRIRAASNTDAADAS